MVKIQYYAKWYDMWIGLFPDVKHRTVYVFIIPCILGFKITY